MLAARMRVGEIGIRTFHPEREVIGHEQVKNTINAVRCHPLAARTRKVVSNVICRGRSVMLRQFGKNRFAHTRPLLARFDQGVARSIDEAFARMFVMCMIMSSHAAYIGAGIDIRQSCNLGSLPRLSHDRAAFAHDNVREIEPLAPSPWEHPNAEYIRGADCGP